MNELITSLSENEMIEVANHIERLFILQDKRISKQALAMYAKELSDTGMPYAAILKGIDSLRDADLGTIKLTTLIGAAREFVQKENHVSNCNECYDGYVVMTDDEGRYHSFACNCGRGQSKAATQNIKRWNGESVQSIRGAIFTKTGAQSISAQRAEACDFND